MVHETKLCQIIILALILLVSTTSAGRMFRLHRTVREAETTSTESAAEPFCQDNTPCGWAVYIPFTRKVDYFMKNTCTCSSENNLACVKSDDDLSISAYVYRCRQIPKN